MRVVLHAHSEWSYDGTWTLGAIARLFGTLGVRVVLMSEHDTGFDPAQFGKYVETCRAASTKHCMLVPGIEYSSPDNAVHILAWGVDRFLGAGRATEDTLRDVRAEGGVAVFAHPARRDAWRAFRPEWVPFLSGIELWNRKTDGIAPSRPAIRLLSHASLPFVVGLDFHAARHLYPLDNVFRPEGTLPLDRQVLRCLRDGALRPRAFGRDLGDALEQSGADRLRAHFRADAIRRRLRHGRAATAAGTD